MAVHYRSTRQVRNRLVPFAHLLCQSASAKPSTVLEPRGLPSAKSTFRSWGVLDCATTQRHSDSNRPSPPGGSLHRSAANPRGYVAEMAEVNQEAVCTVFVALPESILFSHDGRSPLKIFNGHDNVNVTHCCIVPTHMQDESSWSHISCPLECTPAGRITHIYSDPSLEDMHGPSGSGGSCPPGALSPAIGNLAELSSLVFRHSCLAGDLPDSVTHLQKLTEIEMPDNNFSGPIPPGLFHLPALCHLHLNTLASPEGLVGLSGSLPDNPDTYSPSLEVAGAYSRSITALILCNNSLSGAIPAALAEMTALQKLDPGENRLSGAVTAALCDSESLKLLEEVLLNGNALTGPFCNALLPASKLWLGFNDLGGVTRAGGGSGGEEEDEGSLHGCMLTSKLELLSAPHVGLRGSVLPDLFLETNE
ncbi:unnamed protein product [Closterium sp. NIES-53]